MSKDAVSPKCEAIRKMLEKGATNKEIVETQFLLQLERNENLRVYCGGSWMTNNYMRKAAE